jgi:F-type H+-transporting ATPase subunit a
MEVISEVKLSTFSLFGRVIEYNPVPFVMAGIVAVFIMILAFIVRKNMSLVPGKVQSIFEMIYDFLKEITVSTLGEEDGKKYLPLVMTLFIFILMANWIGIIPNILRFSGAIFAIIHKFLGGDVTIVVHSITDLQLHAQSHSFYGPLLHFHGFEEPTRSVNMDLALASVVFIICHALGIRRKGLFKYLETYLAEPFPNPIPTHGAWLLLAPLNPIVYFNLFMGAIGLVSTVVSHGFRLFGNIFGGGMIIVIVSTLLKFFLVPVGLLAFFGLFAGFVQAFVFTMLTVTYIQQQQ